MKMSRADRKNFVDSWYTPDPTLTAQYTLTPHSLITQSLITDGWNPEDKKNQ